MNNFMFINGRKIAFYEFNKVPNPTNNKENPNEKLVK
jgi:hypothetical protein